MAVPITVGDVIPSLSPAKGVIEWWYMNRVPTVRPIVSLLSNGEKEPVILPLTSKRK